MSTGRREWVGGFQPGTSLRPAVPSITPEKPVAQCVCLRYGHHESFLREPQGHRHEEKGHSNGGVRVRAGLSACSRPSEVISRFPPYCSWGFVRHCTQLLTSG